MPGRWHTAAGHLFLPWQSGWPTGACFARLGLGSEYQQHSGALVHIINLLLPSSIFPFSLTPLYPRSVPQSQALPCHQDSSHSQVYYQRVSLHSSFLVPFGIHLSRCRHTACSLACSSPTWSIPGQFVREGERRSLLERRPSGAPWLRLIEIIWSGMQTIHCQLEPLLLSRAACYASMMNLCSDHWPYIPQHYDSSIHHSIATQLYTASHALHMAECACWFSPAQTYHIVQVLCSYELWLTKFRDSSLKQLLNTVKMKSAAFAFTLVAAVAAQDIAALAQCGVSASPSRTFRGCLDC